MDRACALCDQAADRGIGLLGLILLAVAIAVCVMAVASQHISEAVLKFAAVTGIFGAGMMWSVVTSSPSTSSGCAV